MLRFVLVFVAIILGTVSILHADTHKACEPGLNVAWVKCAESADCVNITYGCYGDCPVNKKFEDEAREKLYEIGGDPTELDCVQLDEDGNSLFVEYGPPSCKEGLCSSGKDT